MEYVYAALLLHKLKQDINEDNVKNVIKATGVSPDDIQVKSLIAAISEVNIDDALKAVPMAAAPMAAPSPSPTTAGATTEKEDEKKEEKKEEEALEGLSSLFG
jgi:large subunit ribosomal protein L12